MIEIIKIVISLIGAIGFGYLFWRILNELDW